MIAPTAVTILELVGETRYIKILPTQLKLMDFILAIGIQHMIMSKMLKVAQNKGNVTKQLSIKQIHSSMNAQVSQITRKALIQKVSMARLAHQIRTQLPKKY